MSDRSPLESLNPMFVYVADLPPPPRTIAAGCVFCREPRRHELDQWLSQGADLTWVISHIRPQSRVGTLDDLRRHRDRHVQAMPAPSPHGAVERHPVAELLEVAEVALRGSIDDLTIAGSVTGAGLAGISRLVTVVEQLRQRAVAEAGSEIDANSARLSLMQLLAAAREVSDPEAWRQIGKRVRDDQTLDAMNRFVADNETEDSARRYDELMRPLLRRAEQRDPQELGVVAPDEEADPR